MRILWVSRHRPTKEMLTELRRLFGVDVKIVQEEFVGNGTAEAIRKRFQDGGFDDLLVVAPAGVKVKLCDWGINPLIAKMTLVDPNLRVYRFEGFVRLIALIQRTESVQPSASLSVNDKLYLMLLSAVNKGDLARVERIVQVLKKRLTPEELNALLIKADKDTGQAY